MILSLRKKIILSVVALLVIVGGVFFILAERSGRLFTTAETITGTGQTFSDVAPDYWAYLQIEAAYRAGIVSGYPDGTFRPETVVTRDQGAVFVARAVAGGDSKVPTSTQSYHCRDVQSTYWAYKYVQYLFEKGVITECNNYPYTLAATLPLTREVMSEWLAGALVGGASKVPAGPATATFKDVPTTYWAYKYIEYLAGQGLISGYPDGTFHPTENVTRAQMAVFVTRAFDLIGSALIANISGKVTDSTGNPLSNGYLVLEDDIIKINSDGTYTDSGLEATTYDVEIFDQNGNQYESPSLDAHIISPAYGNNIINFSGLVKQ
jgi:hypothetical protein